MILNLVLSKQGAIMGHKGANKLKPKKAKLTDNKNMYISSIVHPGSKSPAQSPVKNNESDKGEKKPASGSSKKNKKGR
jgi:hypothetical protein